jgi:hypothetical protein
MTEPMRHQARTEAAPELQRWAGIDPGGTAGLICVAIPSSGPRRLDIEAARLVGIGQASATTAKGYTRAGARGTMLNRIRQQLIDWQVTHVAMEEPSNQTASWKAAKGVGRATGSLFYLGMHTGLALGAVITMPWPVHVWSYPPTTDKRKRGPVDDEQVGWMQGRQPTIPKRELTLARMTSLYRLLQQRPLDGVLPTLSDMRANVSEHVLMALGVLNYHLLRETGKA